MYLVSALRPKVVVELGANQGDFYSAACHAVKVLTLDTRCYAIDARRERTGADSHEEEISASPRAHPDPRYSEFSDVIQSDFDDALRRFADGSINVLLVSEARAYGIVKRDVESWLPKISAQGVVLFHNIKSRERGCGVSRVWEELKVTYPHFEFVHGQGLGILAAGQSAPVALRSFFDASPEETTVLREFFLRLERTLTEEQSQRIKRRQQMLVDLREELSKKDALIAALHTQVSNIVNSRGWILLTFLWRIRSRLFPRKNHPSRILERSNRQISVERPAKSVAAPPAMAGYAAAPLVSIVIPVFNALEYTQQCVESLYAKGAGVSFETIVVDDGSTDATNEWLATAATKYDNFFFLRNAENVGFARSVNRGVQQSRGKFVVLLNNDTLVTPNWLDRLITTAERDDSIGIVSPMTNYVGEGIQLDERARNLQPAEADNYAGALASRDDLVYEPRRLVFFCVLIKRAVFNAIGLLDERYGRGNFEDDDYCLRARVAQFKLAVATNAFVYHHGSKTFEANNISHDELMERNRDQYYKKVSDISGHLYHASTRREISRNCAVSVIVRTLDRPTLLKNALASLSNQTWEDFEVVLVNDGGRYPREALECFDGLLNLRYVEHENTRGRTYALNNGIRNASGRFITYLDDDDIVYPWHLEILAREVSTGNRLYVHSGYNRALVKDSRVVATKAADASWHGRSSLMVENYIPMHCWIHSRDAVDTIGGFDEELDLLEDWDFLLRLSSICDFHHIDIPTCEYRFSLDGANSLTAQRSKSLAAIKRIYERHPTREPEIIRLRNERLRLFQEQLSQMERIMSQAAIGENSDQIVASQQVVELITGF
jgi:GT2 family glycosyltransferase